MPFVEKVQSLNPGWQYKLWTNLDNENFVKNEFPDFQKVYDDLSRPIMKADVIRYLIMYKIGGVCLNLDYEVLQPFDFKDYKIILPQSKSRLIGDKRDELGNSIFAPEPGHIFWYAVIEKLTNHPPKIANYLQIPDATGPGLLSRVYFSNMYENVYVPEKMVYHPPTPGSNREINKIKNNGVSLGIHHPWGSWKERWTGIYLYTKMKQIFGFR